MSENAGIPMDYATLGVKVDALEGDFREVKASITGLDTKIDRAISNLSAELRTSISGLSTQFAERNRTPWGTISGVGGIALVVVGAFVNQALSPILFDVKELRDKIVPRAEYLYRQVDIDRQLSVHENWLKKIELRQYDQLERTISRLTQENQELRNDKK